MYTCVSHSYIKNECTYWTLVMTDHCLECGIFVRPRQEALQCDGCYRWQHRLCDTGISQELRATNRGTGLDTWHCIGCKAVTTCTTGCTNSIASNSMMDCSVVDAVPIVESTRVDADNTNVSPMNDQQNTSSFDISQRSFLIPEMHLEESIEDPQPQELPDDDDNNDNVRFYVAKKGTTRQRRKLADTRGYTYTVKRVRNNGVVDWWCAIRTKTARCLATVIERDSEFTLGKMAHNHDSKPGAILNLKIMTQVKDLAAKEIFMPSSDIVQKALVEHADSTAPPGSRHKVALLQRITNRHREKMRPKEPVDLDFEVNYDYLPEDFVRKDITVDGSRHLICATDQQLDVLSRAKVWYLDGTFKIIRRPFVQMFSIYAFLRSGEHTKQVPLLFCLMSSRKKKDYKKVLKKVIRLLPTLPAVKEFVIDFERGMWQSIRGLFPNAQIKGCAFHWGQAVWRHVQSLGLQIQYRNRDTIYKFVRRLMALCFLPHEHIKPAFDRMQAGLDETSPKLEELMQYMGATWIDSTIWPCESWSVFMRPTRTNNDVEG